MLKAENADLLSLVEELRRAFDKAQAMLEHSAFGPLQVEFSSQKRRIEQLESALRAIANGDGYYGAQARDYKEIARLALEQR